VPGRPVRSLVADGRSAKRRPGLTETETLGQIEAPGDLPDQAVTALAQLHDLGLKLGRERPARTRLAAFQTSMMDILPGVALLIVGVRQTGSGPRSRSHRGQRTPRSQAPATAQRAHRAQWPAGAPAAVVLDRSRPPRETPTPRGLAATQAAA
jgi:hypothetical protein